MTRAARAMGSLAVAVALVAAFAACGMAGSDPEISVEWLDGTSWVPLAPGDPILVSVALPEETATTILLNLGGTAAGGINSFHCFRDNVEVPLDIQRSLQGWSAELSLELAIAEPHIELDVRLVDRRGRDAIRAIHVYYNPDIIDQLYVGGTAAQGILSEWASEPMQLMVVLQQDVVGTYGVTVSGELWDPGTAAFLADPTMSWDLGAEPPDAPTFPATPGRYRFTVHARDQASGYGEDAAFEAYVHSILITQTGFTGFTSAHAVGGSKFLTLTWGDLDGAAGAGLWIVEVRTAMAAPHTCESGTGAVIDFDDIGAYRLRVGVQHAETDPFAYTRELYTGYVGTNTLPVAPVVGAVTNGTITMGTADVETFSVTGFDADGDPYIIVVDRGTLFGLVVYYETVAPRTFSWSYKGAAGEFQDRNGDNIWDFYWDIPAPTFQVGDPNFSLSFRTQDSYETYSTEVLVNFTLAP